MLQVRDALEPQRGTQQVAVDGSFPDSPAQHQRAICSAGTSGHQPCEAGEVLHVVVLLTHDCFNLSAMHEKAVVFYATRSYVGHYLTLVLAPCAA